MSVALISTPQRTVNGLLTNVQAALSQVPYQFLRSDHNATYVDSTGNAGFTVGSTTAFAVGDNIFYVESVESGKTGLYVIESLPTGTEIRTSSLFIAPAGGVGYLNSLTQRADYKLVCTLADENLVALLPPFLYQTKNNGELFIDWSSVVIPLTVQSFQFRLIYQQYYSGALQGAPVNTITIQALEARKQQLAIGGGAMWENLLNLIAGSGTIISMIADVDDDVQATMGGGSDTFVAGNIVVLESKVYGRIITTIKGVPNVNVYRLNTPFIESDTGTLNGYKPRLLTKFKNPIFWDNWNRTASVLMDSSYQSRTGLASAIFRANSYDINKVIIAGGSTDTNITTSPDIKTLIVVDQKRVNQAFIGLDITNSGKTIIVSERYFYRIENECAAPLMVEWRNSLGGVEQHLFSIQQTINTDSNEGTLFNKPITVPLDQAADTIGRFPTVVKERITVTAENLLIDQLRALMEIKSSREVSVYLSKDGLQKVRVRCTNLLNTTYNTKTKGAGYSITVELEMPDNFSLFDSVNYGA